MQMSHMEEIGFRVGQMAGIVRVPVTIYPDRSKIRTNGIVLETVGEGVDDDRKNVVVVVDQKTKLTKWDVETIWKNILIPK